MMKRLVALIVGVFFLLALAAAFAAQRQPMAMKKMSSMGEKARCTKTCTTLMDYYNKTSPKMKAREGNKQCWDTCWSRNGKGMKPNAAGLKSFWMGKMPMNLRANQCAQACWRKHHDNSNTVQVAGWRSMPRASACAPGMMQ